MKTGSWTADARRRRPTFPRGNEGGGNAADAVQMPVFLVVRKRVERQGELEAGVRPVLGAVARDEDALVHAVDRAAAGAGEEIPGEVDVEEAVPGHGVAA